MTGYVNFTLSKSPDAHWVDEGRVRFYFKMIRTKSLIQPECFYKGFRDENGQLTPVHWYILALKFLFVIIFEHFVFGVCKLIDIMVPDIPESLDIKIKRERYLAKEALQDAEHSKKRQRRNTEGPDTEPEADLEIASQPNGKPKIDQP